MIELPFTLTIDYIIEIDNHFDEDVFLKLLSEMKEISPLPQLKIYLKTCTLFNKIQTLLDNFQIKANFFIYWNKNLTDIPDSPNVNIVIKMNHTFLYETIKMYNNHNVKIILEPSQDFEKAKIELEKIKKDSTLNNIFIQPYLTEYEQEQFAKNVLNRKFLTCATAWLNPIINENGDLYCCKFNKIGNIKNQELLELWNNEKANLLRQKLIEEKNIKNCISCLKKYSDSFLIVDDGEFNYNNNKYLFPAQLNYVTSSPKAAIIGEKESENVYTVQVEPVFSDEDLANMDKSNILFLLE